MSPSAEAPMAEPTSPTTKKAGPVAVAPAEARWENEGGAPPVPPPASTDSDSNPPRTEARIEPDAPVPEITVVPSPVPSPGLAAELDDRQDDLMAVASADGRPPAHQLRVVEWRWVITGLLIFVAALIAWGVLASVDAGIVIPGVVFGIILLGSASPVWISGLIRAREQRAARRSAKSERTVVHEH